MGTKQRQKQQQKKEEEEETRDKENKRRKEGRKGDEKQREEEATKIGIEENVKRGEKTMKISDTVRKKGRKKTANRETKNT